MFDLLWRVAFRMLLRARPRRLGRRATGSARVRRVRECERE